MTFLTCVGLIPLHRMSMPFPSLPPWSLAWEPWVFTKWMDTVPAVLDTVPAVMSQVLNVGGISAAYLLCGLKKYHNFCSYEVGQARRTLGKTGCCSLSEAFCVFCLFVLFCFPISLLF